MRVFDSQTTEEEVNKMLDIEDEKIVEREIVIEKDLKKQTNSIFKRLNQRIKAKATNISPPFDEFSNAANERLVIPSDNEIDVIVARLISDKRKRILEEEKFKIELIEFEHEKHLFNLEKNNTVLSNSLFHFRCDNND